MRGKTALTVTVIAVIVCGCSVSAKIYPSGYPETENEQSLEFSRQLGDSIFEKVKWTPRTVIAVILTFLVSALANAGGLGGGGFLVPLFNLVLGVSLKQAMGLSQAAITGGALAAGVLHVFSSHPEDSSRPLLDTSIALLFMPCLLVGVTLGVTLNELFPDWILVVIISVLLAIMSVRSFRTGMKLHRSEAAHRERQAMQAETSSLSSDENALVSAASEIPSMLRTPSRRSRTASLSMDLGTLPRGRHSSFPEHNSLPNSLLSYDGSFKLQRAPMTANVVADSQLRKQAEPDGCEADHELSIGIQGESLQDDQKFSLPSTSETGQAESPFQKVVTDSEGPRFQQQAAATICKQIWKLSLGLVLWAAFLALQILKSQHSRCSPAYFSWYAAQVAFGLVCSLSALLHWWWQHRSQAMQSDAERPLLGSESSVDRTYEHSPQRVASCAACVCLGACLCSICGLGGGMILGPVMLDMGLHPLAAASTSLLLVGASSSTATVQFALGDRLEYGWGIIMFLICVVASLVGVAGFGRLVRSSGRASLIVFLLFVLMAGGGLMTLVFGVINTVESLSHGGRVGFLKLCS